MGDPGSGQRQRTADVVLYWMQRRGMARQIFADRMGKSLSWVDKIRAGDRQLDRLSVLQWIANVLDIPLSVLIDPEEAERRRVCPDDREGQAIRQALRRYDAITNVFRPNGDVLPKPDLLKLERTVSRGYLQAGRRDEAATALLDADQLAREEVRCRQLTRQILTDLVRSYPLGVSPLSTLKQLARAVGVTI